MRIGKNILFWTGMRSGSGVIFRGNDIVIVDSQMRKDQATLMLELMELYGLNSKNIKYVINSHGDPDHVGGNAELLRATKAKLVAHTLDADIIEDPGKRPMGGSPFTAAREGPREGCKVDVKIKGNDEILKVGALSLRLILTPGHTSGSMSIYDEESKALFTGDLVLGSGYDCYSVPMVRAGIETVIRSLEKLSVLNVEWLLPGHGDVIYGARTVNERIKGHIRELNRLPNRIMKILGEKASTVAEVSDELLVWPQTVEKVLSNLEKEGKIQKVEEKTTTTTSKWKAA